MGKLLKHPGLTPEYWVDYKGQTLRVKFGRYPESQALSICLIDKKGNTIAEVTHDTPEHNLPDSVVAIDDTILQKELIRQQVILPTVLTHISVGADHKVAIHELGFNELLLNV